MEDGPAHVWWLVRRGEVWVVEVSGRSSAVLVMSSLTQLLVLLCGDVYLYPSHGQWVGEMNSILCTYREKSSFDWLNFN